MTRSLRSYTLALAVQLMLAVPASALTFTPYNQFPEQAGSPYSSPTGVALPNGRLLIWNGDGLYVQKLPGADAFTEIATGYSGDPAFAALAPDGHTVLLGAGGFGGEPYLNNLYLFDTENPVDYTPGAVVASTPHYAGVYLSANLVLLEVGRSDFTGSELHIIDLASKSRRTGAVVVTGMPSAPPTKDLVVDKPTFTYSGALAIDHANGIVYATASSFSAPPDQELRYFSVQALIDAYNTSGTLDWSVDGTLVGGPNQFFGGGVSGVTQAGRLVNGGSGGVQIIDPNLGNPAAASVVETLDPANTGGFYSAIYNPALDDLVLLESLGEVWGPENGVQPVPAVATGGLAGLGALLLAVGMRRSSRRK